MTTMVILLGWPSSWRARASEDDVVGGTPARPAKRAMPYDALAIACADAGAVDDPDLRPWLRYIWTVSNDDMQAAITAFAINTAVSRYPTPVKVVRVGDNSIIRVNLYDLARTAGDRVKLVELWDKMAEGEPYFYATGRVVEKVAPYKADDGKVYDYKWKDARAFGGHVHIDLAVQLLGLIRTSRYPIVRGDFFRDRVLSNLNGGMYYEFADIKKSPDKRTDFEFFLDQRGVDRAKWEGLDASRRAAIFESGVAKTGVRAIEEVQGPLGVVVWTEDLAVGKGDRNARSHPHLNLLDPQEDGLEVIALRANEFCSFAAFDGKGNLVDVVPDNIATDEVPTAKDQRLTPGLSCMRCHRFNNGFRTLRNDALTDLQPLIEGGTNLNVVFDLSEKDPAVALAKIRSNYRDNLSRLMTARLAYAKAVFEVTGMSIEQVATGLRDADTKYRFDPVGPALACRELGIDVGDADATAAKVLSEILPPVIVSATATTRAHSVREDPRINHIRKGGRLSRVDWEAVYADAAVRSLDAVFKLTGRQRIRLPAVQPQGAAK